MFDSKITFSFRLATICGGVLFVVGCSVTDYKSPINDLYDAIDSSVTTVKKIDQEITKAQNNRWKELIEKDEAFLLTPDDSCASGNKSCSLLIRFSGSHSKGSHFPAESMMPKALVGLSGLKDYVSSLKSIVDAETAGAVTASVNEALASAAKIEAEVAKAKNPDAKSPEAIKGYSEPLIASVNWLVSQYVERVKHKALAAATKRAQPVIESLSGYNQTVSDAAATLKAAEALKVFSAAQEAYDAVDTKNDIVINTYTKAAEAYDIVLKGRAAHPLKQFLEAHTKLNDTLNNNGETSLADTIAAIKEFKKRAKEFKQIIDDFKIVAINQTGE
jgi:hypothetical protein